jgi:Cof subfamily protein (haloacid dehalogenase superfamily)
MVQVRGTMLGGPMTVYSEPGVGMTTAAPVRGRRLRAWTNPAVGERVAENLIPARGQGFHEAEGEAGEAVETLAVIDLVAIDIDGTLLDSHGAVSAGAAAGIAEARTHGIQVALASGRSRFGLFQIMQLLGLQLPYICSGGAYIGNAATGEVIQHTPLARRSMQQVVTLARKAGASIFMVGRDHIYAEAGPEVVAAISSLASIDIHVVLTEDVLRAYDDEAEKIMLVKDPVGLAGLDAELRQQADAVYVSYSSPVYLEITKAGVNKGSALKYLASHLGIPMSRVAAIGDERNDLSMFAVAGLAIAMGNAPADVQAAAEMVAPGNNEAGVAWATRRILQARVSATE